MFFTSAALPLPEAVEAAAYPRQAAWVPGAEEESDCLGVAVGAEEESDRLRAGSVAL